MFFSNTLDTHTSESVSFILQTSRNGSFTGNRNGEPNDPADRDKAHRASFRCWNMRRGHPTGCEVSGPLWLQKVIGVNCSDSWPMA